MKTVEKKPTAKEEVKETKKPATKNTGVVSGPDESPKKIDPSSQPIHDGETKVNDGSGPMGYDKKEN
jgi:hypothetical protein